MFTENFLGKIGFSSEDAKTIINLNSKYSHKIMPLVKEYIEGIKEEFCLQYKEGERAASHQRGISFIESIHEKLPEIDKYAASLLGWLNCVPHLAESYKKYGVREDIFYDSMKDLSYKLEECKDVQGAFGLATDWFFLFFELKLFALGRLEYEVYPFGFDEYSRGGITLKKGDTVYYCHIPSSGKLTTDMCMDSFQKAYEFFKPQLNGDVIPIISHTWLLYKPYLDHVYPKGSNLESFAKLFDIIDTASSGNAFHACWRIFNKDYEGTTDGLPADTTLRRNFIKYINDGGDFGNGYGIILYNGKTREIINQSN